MERPDAVSRLVSSLVSVPPSKFAAVHASLRTLLGCREDRDEILEEIVCEYIKHNILPISFDFPDGPTKLLVSNATEVLYGGKTKGYIHPPTHSVYSVNFTTLKVERIGDMEGDLIDIKERVVKVFPNVKTEKAIKFIDTDNVTLFPCGDDVALCYNSKCGESYKAGDWAKTVVSDDEVCMVLEVAGEPVNLDGAVQNIKSDLERTRRVLPVFKDTINWEKTIK